MNWQEEENKKFSIRVHQIMDQFINFEIPKRSTIKLINEINV